MPITLCFHESHEDLKTEIIFFHEFIYLRRDGSAAIMQEGIVEVLSASSAGHSLRELFLALPCKVENLIDISNTLMCEENRLCYTGSNPHSVIKPPVKFAYHSDQNKVILDSIDFYYRESCVEVRQDVARHELIKVTFCDPITYSECDRYRNRRGFRVSYTVNHVARPLRWWTGHTAFTFYLNSLQSAEYERYANRFRVPITLWYLMIAAPPRLTLKPGIQPMLSKDSSNPHQFDLWLKAQLSEFDLSEMKKSMLPNEDNRYGVKRIYYSNIGEPFRGYNLPDTNLPTTGLTATIQYPDLPRWFQFLMFGLAILGVILGIWTLLR